MGGKLASEASHQASAQVCAGESTGLCPGQLSRNFLGMWALSHLPPSRMALPPAETQHEISVETPAICGHGPWLSTWKIRGQPLLFKVPVTFADLIVW